MGAAHARADPPALLDQQELHLDGPRVRRRGRPARARRHGARPLPRVRRRGPVGVHPVDDPATPRLDGERARPRDVARGGGRGSAGTGPRLPGLDHRSAAPGSVFAYSQPCTYTVAAAIQRRTGQRLSEYLRPRLFDPLGIGEVGWRCFPPGASRGSAACSPGSRTSPSSASSTSSAAGGATTSSSRRRTSTRPRRPRWRSPNEDKPDWSQGYGYCFWIARHGYRGDGAFGQFCIVLPEHDAVIAITGGTEAMQEVVDHVWEHLLPGLGGAPVDASAQDALDRAAAYARPPAVRAPIPHLVSPSQDVAGARPGSEAASRSLWATTVGLERHGVRGRQRADLPRGARASG